MDPELKIKIYKNKVTCISKLTLYELKESIVYSLVAQSVVKLLQYHNYIISNHFKTTYNLIIVYICSLIYITKHSRSRSKVL